MNIVFHIGAHGTDSELLLKSVLRNRNALFSRGVATPAPAPYRKLLHETIGKLNGAKPTEDMQQLLLDTIVPDEGINRLILSHENFLSGSAGVIRDGMLYPNATDTFARLANLLPGSDFEFFLAIKNPVSLLVDMLKRLPSGSYGTVMGMSDPRDLRWAPVIRRMLPYLGANRLVIWCREDTGFVWPEVLRLMMDLPPAQSFMGPVALLMRLVTDEGMKMLTQKWKDNPKSSVDQIRADIEVALITHARPDSLDDLVVIPGWTQALIDEITRNYEEDIAEIAALPGVEFITP